MSASSLVLAPLVSEWLLAALAAVLVLASAFAAWRGLRGWVWRLLAGLGVLAALANPALVREIRDPLSDIVLVVRDTSTSMSVGERSENAEAASAAIARFAEADDSLDLVEVRGGAAPDGTRLIEEVRSGLGDIPRNRLAGIIVISDGQVHDVPSDPAALGLEAPFHHFAVGDPRATDRRLIVEEAPRFGIVGEPVRFRLRVEDEGAPAGTAMLTLRLDGGDPIRARATIGETVTVEALVQNRGANVIEIEVEPGASELSLINNRAAVSVTGVRDRLRVLLVTGEPHNGARAWRNLLKSDPSVDLVHFTILRPLDRGDGALPEELALIAFPVFELFELRLHEFDLIIFDRYRRRGILPANYFQNIARYVDEGGALLITAGPDYAGEESIARSLLAGVLPARPTGAVREGAFRPRISTAGERHPVTAPLAGEAQDWGNWYRYIGGQVLAGETLLDTPSGDPLLVLSRQGQGRAAILLSDQSWLWARGHDGGGPHDELFRRAAHWLMNEPELDEERLTASLSDGMLSATRTTLADTAPDLEVTWPSGREESLSMTGDGPGRFTAATETGNEAGLIRLRSGEATTVISAGPLNPREYLDLRVTRDALAPLTSATSGSSFMLGGGSEPDMPSLRRTRAGGLQAGPGWAGLQRNGAYTVSESRRTPLAPGLLVAALILALMGMGWWREGK
ncbi:MAG: hypothetical protein ACQRW7_02720 [Caulobacterales bacterium]|uniref:hypothetical protein n=1 Tax=Glycocaulis sp. TaxID=1969725 RepID=UPI003F9F43FD